jgi:hypothetical protein
VTRPTPDERSADRSGDRSDDRSDARADDSPSAPLRARIRELLAATPAPDGADFDELALAAFAFQVERIAPLRELCARRGVDPARLAAWHEVPLVPVAAFRSVELAAAPPREVFRSSGTHGPERSVHRHPYPDLYRAAIDASFPHYCLPRGDRPPMLSLVPSRELAPDSSLGFMVAHLLERHGGPGSAYAVGPRGVEAGAARSWLGARQRSGAPVMILATAFALAELLEALDRLGLRFRLAPGSAVFLTGGFKGRRRALDERELATALADGLGLGAEAIVGEYGMTELTSQAYTRTLLGGRGDLFVTPPWLRFRILSPESLEPLADGEPGLLALFDLANLGSALHVLTEDLAVAEPVGFRLIGRAAGAALRGCSLLAEELSLPDL